MATEFVGGVAGSFVFQIGSMNAGYDFIASEQNVACSLNIIVNNKTKLQWIDGCHKLMRGTSDYIIPHRVSSGNAIFYSLRKKYFVPKGIKGYILYEIKKDTILIIYFSVPFKGRNKWTAFFWDNECEENTSRITLSDINKLRKKLEDDRKKLAKDSTKSADGSKKFKHDGDACWKDFEITKDGFKCLVSGSMITQGNCTMEIEVAEIDPKADQSTCDV